MFVVKFCEGLSNVTCFTQSTSHSSVILVVSKFAHHFHISCFNTDARVNHLLWCGYVVSVAMSVTGYGVAM